MNKLPLEQLAIALEERSAHAPDLSKADKAARLAGHIREYLLPRLDDLDAPLVVTLLGATGSGKSSLFNAIVGRPTSASGLLRPTTRQAVAYAHPADANALRLAGLTIVEDPNSPRGLVLVDSPDFDSVEVANRQVALSLLEVTDMAIFVTTVTRYADFVPWEVLARVRERGVPLLAVINRMPVDDSETRKVLADYRRLLAAGGIENLGAVGRLEVVAVPEGAIDPEYDGIDRSTIGPILAAIRRLREEAETRREVASRALKAALGGLPEAVEPIAREVHGEEEARKELLDLAESSYGRAVAELRTEIENGTFLRAEVLRQWLDFVRAGPTARFLSEGIGRIAGRVRSLFRPAPTTPPNVRDAAFADLVASAVQAADGAARRTASGWAGDEHGATLLADDPTLWGASSGFAEALQPRLQGWVGDIADEIAAVGQQRKGWAQAATLGLNVLGTSAMLAVFVHTGGLTGAEVGIGAATAVVNQKLLEAIFGEANVAAFVRKARERLDELLQSAFAREEERFVTALGPLGATTGLAENLRRLAQEAQATVA